MLKGLSKTSQRVGRKQVWWKSAHTACQIYFLTDEYFTWDYLYEKPRCLYYKTSQRFLSLFSLYVLECFCVNVWTAIKEWKSSFLLVIAVQRPCPLDNRSFFLVPYMHITALPFWIGRLSTHLNLIVVNELVSQVHCSWVLCFSSAMDQGRFLMCDNVHGAQHVSGYISHSQIFSPLEYTANTIPWLADDQSHCKMWHRISHWLILARPPPKHYGSQWEIVCWSALAAMPC